MKNLKVFCALDTSYLTKVLKLMPMLEELDIQSEYGVFPRISKSSTDYIDQIAELLPNLKHLTLRRLPNNPNSLGGLKHSKELAICLPEVKFKHLLVCDNLVEILKGIQLCSTLQELYLYNMKVSSFVVFI